MRNRAFVFSGMAFLMVIPTIILAASITSMQRTGTATAVTQLKGNKVFVLFEVIEKDLERAGAISGRRAAVAVYDYISTYNTTLDSYTSPDYGSGTCGAIKEMVMEGTLTGYPYDPSSLMNGNTALDWITNLNNAIGQMGFELGISPPSVDEVTCDCYNGTHFYIKSVIEGSVSDETGDFSYDGSFPRSGFATALISTSDFSIEIFQDCGNELPVAVISSPSNHSSYVEGSSVSFVGNASYDPDGGTPLTYSWSSNLDGVLSSSNVTNPITLSFGTHTITLTVTDTEGGINQSSISVTITPNNPPIPIITSPTDGSVWPEDETIDFDGSSSDDPDDYIVAYEWVSDLNGTMGTSPIFIGTLTQGIHTITLTVTDSYGAENSTFITIVVGTGEIGETKIISGVDALFQTVNLDLTYTTPVIACSHNTSNAVNEAVVRIDNVQSTSFDLKIQNPGDDHPVTAGDVHCIIIEEGSWNLTDDRFMEAYRVTSTGTNENSDWDEDRMEDVGYSLSYTNPVVLGQVMSYNDTGWSVFLDSNGKKTANKQQQPPDDELYVGKHVGKDSVTARNNEILGYIVVEEGSGTVNGIDYEAALGGVSVQGVGDSPPYSYSFIRLGVTYSVGIVTKAAEKGGDGGFAVLYGADPLALGQIDLAIDEDTISTDRSHTTEEEVAYWVFREEGIITGLPIIETN